MVCFFNFFLSVRSGLSTFICFFGYQAKVVPIGQRVMGQSYVAISMPICLNSFAIDRLGN